MITRDSWMPVFLAAALASGWAVGGEEPAGPGDAGAEAKPGKDAERGRGKEILRKMRAGEPLTPDEQALVEKRRAQRDAAGGEAARPGPEGLELVNAVDAVKIALAAAYAAKDRPDEAIKVLEELLAETGDPTAQGFARLELARALRRKGEAARADAELKKVRGPAAVQAILELLAAGGPPTPERLEELLKTAEEPLVRAVLIRRLAGLYAEAGNVEKLADLAARAGKLLKREEALAALEVEARLRAARPGPAPAGGPPGGAARGEAGAGRKHPAAAEAERLQKEIKELEDAGLKKEAAAKRKELEALKARAGKKQKEAEPVPANGDDLF